MKNPVSDYFNKRAAERQTKLNEELIALCVSNWWGDAIVQKIETALASGANVNARQPLTGNTPLHLAAARGDTRLMERLLKAGADVDPRNEAGRTPLMEATKALSEPAVKMLLAHKADVTATDAKTGKGLIHEVLEAPLKSSPRPDGHDKAQTKCLGVLIAHGAVPTGDERRAIFGWKPYLRSASPELEEIHKFCMAGIERNWRVVTEMLDKGMAPDAPAEFGAQTALMAAAMGGNTGMIRKLLALGADPNRAAGPWTSFDFTATPLHAAMRYRHTDAALTLMEAGGDPHRPIHDGEWQPVSLEAFVGTKVAAEIEAESARRGTCRNLTVRRPLHLKPSA